MQQTQDKSIVKKEFVATYGFKLVVSGLSCKTRHVQQFPSTFSTRKTLEQVPAGVVVASQFAIESLVTGMLHGVPQQPQV